MHPIHDRLHRLRGADADLVQMTAAADIETEADLRIRAGLRVDIAVNVRATDDHQIDEVRFS